jgi:serine/threonine protein kinase
MKVCPSCQASYQADFTHCPRDGAALSEIGAWHDGTLVRGKYRILGKVGEGGMAVVYKAMHVRFEELRALKVMNEELARDRAFVKRFMHEAVLTRKLQHASAVRVDDIDEAEDGRPFIVMEFVEGRALKEVIQAEAPIPAARVCPLIRQIAGALDAAHRMGIVHRDVKPANIVLVTPTAADEPERAKLLDFGIAKAREGRLDEATRGTTLTGTGHVIGTPAYMSPEQAKGLRGDQIDGRSDIYSLGIVAYEMLLGALPFKADTSMQWILAHLQTPPRPLWEARPELQIPYAVAGVVMRCLEKDPHKRPANATALIGEIEWAEHAAGYAAAGNLIEVRYDKVPPAATQIGAPYSYLDVARSSASRITGQAGTLRRDEAHLDPEPKSRTGWVVGVMACLLIAGGLAAWKFWPPASRRTSAPAGQTNTNMHTIGVTGQAVTNPAGAMRGSNAIESPHTENAAVDSVGASANTQGASAENRTTGEPSPSSRGSQRSGPTPEAVNKSAPDKREPKAAFHGTSLAEALLRARDDENQGRFEDALREYEQASALDSSDNALKQHIRRLRLQVEREKEVIH